MKLLVLGAEGMLGSVLMRHFPEAMGTTKRREIAGNPRLLYDVDIARRADLLKALDWAEPDVVVNSAGIVKSECESVPEATVHAVNGIAPHYLAAFAEGRGCRVVQVSTDCVFDGHRGARVEAEPPDALDLYGRSKAMGELGGFRHCVTLRTSFIGRDHVRKRGLLEWLLGQRDETLGYEQMFWSGVSAPELARVIALTVARPELHGLYHVSGPKISKADLLQTLIDAFGLSCRLRRVDTPRLDRSLDGRKFHAATGYIAPSWQDMAKELVAW